MAKQEAKQPRTKRIVQRKRPRRVHMRQDESLIEHGPGHAFTPEATESLQNTIGNTRTQRALAQQRKERPSQQKIIQPASPDATAAKSSAAAQRLPFTKDKAIAIAVDLYKTAHPMVYPGGVWGQITLSPGQILTFPNGQERTIISPSGYGVVYMQDDLLYEQPGHAFIREMQLSAVTEGAKRATGMANLAKLEMELIMAMGPLFARLGITLTKAMVWSVDNYDTLKHLSEWSGTVLEMRNLLKSKFPHTYEFLWNQMAQLILQNLDFELTPSDYAKLIGTLIRSGGVEGVEVVANNLWRFLRIVTIAFVKTATTATGRGTAANLKEKTAALLDAAQQIGSAISKRDAQRVARELSNPETIELLMRLQQALYAVATDLKQLSTTK